MSGEVSATTIQSFNLLRRIKVALKIVLALMRIYSWFSYRNHGAGFTRVSSAIQFGSQVLPASSEKDCSK
jgi:hypothetical protein